MPELNGWVAGAVVGDYGDSLQNYRAADPGALAEQRHS